MAPIISREECKAIWQGNKEYVESVGDNLNIKEAVLLAKKQDALYLAWADEDFTALLKPGCEQ